MKRIMIYFIISVFVLAGCGKDKTRAVNNTAGYTSEAVQEKTESGEYAGISTQMMQPSAVYDEVTEESLRIMKEMVLSDAVPNDLIRYIKEHMAAARPDVAESMLLVLESVQKAWLEYYINSQNGNFGDQAEKDINNNGFVVISIHESMVPVLDYDIYLTWRDKLSEWFVCYLELASEEAGKPAVYNGQLKISLDELEYRLTQASEFIEKYPKCVRINEIINLYDIYLYSYLYGYDSAPVFDYKTNRVSKEFLERYKAFIENNPHLEITEVVSDFVGLLEKNSYNLTTEVETYIQEIFKKLHMKRIVVRNDTGRRFLIERIGMLLPGTGSTWHCAGFAGYEHTAVVESIHTEDSNPVYNVIGQVDDFSDGEIASELMSIFLQYRIESNILSQYKSAPVMNDSDFDELELIRYPFVTGHRWFQYPIDGYNNRCSIETEIIGVSEDEGVSVYEVEYRNLSTGGNEKRLIQAGRGTIGFIKLFTDSAGEVFYVGYSIDTEKSGYKQP